MKVERANTLLAAVAAMAFATASAADDVASTNATRSVNAEVVFVLDTTGSMSGLIEGAKQKIWSIAGGIIQKTGGKVSIGLVPYRDRGDAYVTKIFPITNNLDQVYSDLQGFQAAGGGDMPESVNQALHEAVFRMQWSDSGDVIRTIFLVGDCPPHMDYDDDIKYPETCAAAAKRNIVINTVQCGSESNTTPIWRKIANLTDGGYSQIAQSGNMRMIKTPFDEEIQRVNIELGKTVLPYGSMAVQSAYGRLLRDNASASASVAASRNMVKAKAMEVSRLSAPVEGNDLTENPELLAGMGDADLPAELKGLSPEERKARLDEAVNKRKELNAQLVELNVKRAEYLRKSAETESAAKGAASFDAEVLKSVDRQLESLGGGKRSDER